MASENSVTIVGIDPPDLAAAAPGEVLAFRRRTGELAVHLLRDQMRRGIGRDGQPLVPVKPSSRPDGATGKPLVPHNAASRSSRWLRFSIGKDGVTLWWSHGWAQVLGYHRRGEGRLPVRDVGPSDATLRKLKRAMAQWWRARHREPIVAVPREPALGLPQRAARRPGPATAAGLVARYPHLAQFTPQAAGRPPRPGPTRPPPAPPRQPRPKPAPSPPPEPAPYGPSRATVIAYRGAGQTLEAVLAAAGRLAGRPLTAHDLASLAGATDDARVEVLESSAFGIRIEVFGPGYHAVRFLNRGSEEELYLENQSLDVEPEHQGQGLGSRIFGRQVEQAIAHGVEKIETLAAGSAGDPRYNGYYTWPRFGYDGLISDEIRAKLPPAWAGAERISDLQFSAERRQWWMENGETTWLAFDLREGSTSRLIWDGYRQEKAAAAASKGPTSRRGK